MEAHIQVSLYVDFADKCDQQRQWTYQKITTSMLDNGFNDACMDVMARQFSVHISKRFRPFFKKTKIYQDLNQSRLIVRSPVWNLIEKIPM